MNKGDNIRQFRKAQGLSAEQIASAICVSPATVYRWESGECDPGSSQLCRLADLLGVTTDALLGREINQPTKRGATTMITLNDLLTIVDARQLRIVVPVTPRLKARITVNTRQTAELDDIIALYGERPVFSAEPTHEGNVMEIDLTDRAEVAKREASL